MSKHHWTDLMIKDQNGELAIGTWEFWRTLIMCFFLCCWIGHLLEIPYCIFMEQNFGIVSDEYALWHEPLYTPYWVYGIGAVVMTFVIEPFKDSIAARRKTKAGAIGETFVYTVILAALLETGIGLLINQPDANGVYPFWDNSKFPLNILGQGWLVNDLVIGVAAIVYLYVLYPLIDGAMRKMPPAVSNAVFVGVAVLFGLATFFAYAFR